MNDTIVHDAAAHRFETLIDGYRAVLDYRFEGDIAHLTQVSVPGPIEGRGVAASLTRAALDWARAESIAVVPRCPYVAGWIERHPDYRDVLAAEAP
jgi:uncharacterized protein